MGLVRLEHRKKGPNESGKEIHQCFGVDHDGMWLASFCNVRVRLVVEVDSSTTKMS